MKERPGQKTLNLIIHGLCAFVEQDHHVDIIFPAMPEHTFAAGSWRREMMLDQGETYRLFGVRGENELPDECGECVISQKKSGISLIDPEGDTFCTVRVPMPKEMRPVRSMVKEGDIALDFFVGEAVNQNKLHPSRIPIVYGLRYKIDNLSEVSLGEFWSPDLSEEPKKSINLHIWAEPACNIQRNHVSEGFRSLVGMLPELDLAIHPRWDVDLPDTTIPAFPPDLSENEKELLRQRCQIEPPGGLLVTKLRNCLSIVVRK